MNNKVIIIHNKISENALSDELDVLDQVRLIKSALEEMSYFVEVEEISKNFIDEIESIKNKNPLFVFSLIESIADKGELLYFAPALLNSMKIPYTGNSNESLFLTTHKVLAKQILKANLVPTADYFFPSEFFKINKDKKYIVKPIWEEGSVGLEEDSVFFGNEQDKIDKFSKLPDSHYFIEEFIEGKEFNISLLANGKGAEMLEPAEMIFIDFPEGKPKILGYRAKWDEDSFEYKNTQRSFNTLNNNFELYEKLKQISLKCWEIFKLKGYVRVDFRVDENNNPYVLEINGNPCISPDSGFIAALKYSGLTELEAVKRIITDLNN
jgi:D-alanine-D-alanine ligase